MFIVPHSWLLWDDSQSVQRPCLGLTPTGGGNKANQDVLHLEVVMYQSAQRRILYCQHQETAKEKEDQQKQLKIKQFAAVHK